MGTPVNQLFLSKHRLLDSAAIVVIGVVLALLMSNVSMAEVNQQQDTQGDARNLQTQYEQLQAALETEDAFSPVLSEKYFGYAQLLKQAGRYDEALDAFTRVLHLEKINDGLYSSRQGSALHALFDLHLLRGDLHQSEDALKRLLWVEKKNNAEPDQLTFNALVKLGNYYIDQVILNPRSSDLRYSFLSSANNLFETAIKKFGDLPISDTLMPYGELALVNSYLGKMKFYKRDKDWVQFNSRRNHGRNEYYQSHKDQQTQIYLHQSYARAEYYLRKYLSKAEDESQVQHQVQALLGLADLNMIYANKFKANQYYQRAWQQAQSLDAVDELRKSFENPVKLPAFNYAQQRTIPDKKLPFVEVPVDYDVNASGQIRNLALLNNDMLATAQATRVKAIAKRTLFRPAIEDGKPVATEQVTDTVKIYDKPSKKKAKE